MSVLNFREDGGRETLTLVQDYHVVPGYTIRVVVDSRRFRGGAKRDLLRRGATEASFTIIRDSNGVKKTFVGQALCAPEDAFDHFVGVGLAWDRAVLQWINSVAGCPLAAFNSAFNALEDLRTAVLGELGWYETLDYDSEEDWNFDGDHFIQWPEPRTR